MTLTFNFRKKDYYDFFSKIFIKFNNIMLRDLRKILIWQKLIEIPFN